MSKLKIDFIGTIFGVVGAILIACNLGINSIGYIFFLFSSVLYTIFGYQIKNKNIMFLNIVFTIVNFIGLINYLK